MHYSLNGENETDKGHIFRLPLVALIYTQVMFGCIYHTDKKRKHYMLLINPSWPFYYLVQRNTFHSSLSVDVINFSLMIDVTNCDLSNV
jgi:hypothetical protein